MTPHRLEVADVFREHGGTYLAENGVFVDHERVLRDIVACRTAALGGHVKRCDKCGHEEFFYKSCGNRHCPKCQGAARAKWVKDRAADLLETPYFHIVFTLPDELGPIALKNKRLVYGILFRAASETLLKVASDPKHLGADIGFLQVLHTWGQTLGLHPHLHCVVPGGGLSRDRKRWISSRKNFFVHVKVLSIVFRAKFVDFLRQAFKNGKLRLGGTPEHLAGSGSFEAKLKSLKRKDWVVYSKPPFGGAKQVLKYLARYTHRVAISNDRLLSIKDDEVTFRWKDYAHQNRKKTMTLKAQEFIRRFLLHLLPRGFKRIRQYGFLANRLRKEKLALARELLRQECQTDSPVSDHVPQLELDVEGNHDESRAICPACEKGRLHSTGEVEPDHRILDRVFNLKTIDTS